jgi:anti-sigma B factor antagonist
MDLNIQEKDGLKIVSMPGEELDASNSKEFRKSMAPLLGDKTNLIFDMEGLRFVDSSGLGALLSCLRQLNSVGGDIKLCGMSKQVRALFELVRMHRIFDIFNNQEEAIRAYQS